MFDSWTASFDDYWLRFYAKYLARLEASYQALFVIPRGPDEKVKAAADWEGWEVVRTRGSDRDVTIEQSVR